MKKKLFSQLHLLKVNLIYNFKDMVLVLKKGATKKEMEEVIAKLPASKGVNTKKFGGTIKLKEDPMVIQKKMRDEWE